MISCFIVARLRRLNGTYALTAILSVLVFTIFLPFLGVTVTVTLHEPTLRAFTELPETLHIFDVDEETDIEIFAPVATGILR